VVISFIHTVLSVDKHIDPDGSKYAISCSLEASHCCASLKKVSSLCIQVTNQVQSHIPSRSQDRWVQVKL